MDSKYSKSKARASLGPNGESFNPFDTPNDMRRTGKMKKSRTSRNSKLTQGNTHGGTRGGGDGPFDLNGLNFSGDLEDQKSEDQP